MKIHNNSKKSFKDINDLSERQTAILKLLMDQIHPLTDREIKQKLGFYDMNQVRPRITELIKKDLIMEVDSVICKVSNKSVRRLSIC